MRNGCFRMEILGLGFLPLVLTWMTAFPVAAQTVVGTLDHPGLKAGAVALYETGGKVLVGDRANGMVYIYDAATNLEVGSVSTGLVGLTQLVVGETHGKVYAACFCIDEHRIAVLNAVTGSFIRHIELPSPGTFAQLVKDDALGRVFAIFVSGSHSFLAIDTATDNATPVTGVEITLYSSVAVNPVTHEVFTTDSLNHLYVIDGGALGVTTFIIEGGLLYLGVNWNENKVYFGQDFINDIGVFNRNTNAYRRLFAGGWARPLAFNPVTNRTYIAGVSFIDGATDTLNFLVPMNGDPLAVRYATNHVYYVGQLQWGETAVTFVALLDEATQLVEFAALDYLPTGVRDERVTINQTTGRVYVIAGEGSVPRPVTVLQDTEMFKRPPVYVSTGYFGWGGTQVLDPVAKKVVDLWPGVNAEYGLAVRPGGGRVYVVDHQFSQLETYWGTGGATWLSPLDTGWVDDAAVPAVTPDGSRVYVTNSYSNNVAVVQTATNTLLTTIPVGGKPWGIAVTPDGMKAFVANRTSHTVSVISTATNTVTATIPVGNSPWGVAVNPSGAKVYVANSGSNTVSVIDAAAGSVIATVNVGTSPHWLAATADGKAIYVGNRNLGTVSVIDTGTDTVVQTVDLGVGSSPEGVVALPDGSEVWVVKSNDSGASSVAAIRTSDYSVTSVPLPASSQSAIPIAIADPTARFAGRVTRSGGSPLAGALLRALQGGAQKGTALANAAGDYSIFNLKPGTYDIEASATSCTIQTAPGRSAGAGRATLVNFALTCGITPPTVTVVAPNGGEKLYTASSYRIEWTASSPVGLSFFDVFYSIDGGVNLTPVPGCSGVSGAARSCTWAAPGPATSLGRIKVTAHDTAGNTASDASNANFSIVAGTPSITVTVPNTAVSWGIGATQPIKWSHNLGTSSYVKIEISRDGGSSWSTISAAFKNTGSASSTYNWTVTGPATTQARIRVSWTSGPASDMSDVNFTIATPFITVTTPNTSTAKWGIGTQQSVTWTTNLGLTDNVRLLLSTDGGATFPVTLAASTPNDKSQVVTVPNNPTTQARVRVEWIANPSIGDASNANFPIAAPYVTVTKPNGGEHWASGSTQTVTWSSNLGSKEYVKIELSTDGGVTWAAMGTALAAAEPLEEAALISSTPSDGSQPVLAPAVSSATCRIRITWLDNPTVNDTSNANFAIGPAYLGLTVPNGGENWPIGLSRTITWSSNIGGYVRLELSTNGGASWSPLVASTLNDGSHAVIVPNPPTTQARVRVTSLAAGFTSYTDTSNANFTIATPFVTVAAPNGGETWTIGSLRTIQWASNAGGYVKIELSRDGGTVWSTLVASTLNDGSHPWTVTAPASPNCRMRVTSTTVPAATDTSDAAFAIQ